MAARDPAGPRLGQPPGRGARCLRQAAYSTALGPLPRSSSRPEAHAGLLPRRAQGQLVRVAPGLVRARTSPLSWTGRLVPDQSAVPERAAGAASSGRPNRRRATIRQPDGAERNTVRADTVRRTGPAQLALDADACPAAPPGRPLGGCVRRRTEDAYPPRTRGCEACHGLGTGGSGAVAAQPGWGLCCDRAGSRRACDRGGRPSPDPVTRQRGTEGARDRGTGRLFTRAPARVALGGVITGANECGIVLASPSQLCAVLFSPAVQKQHSKGRDSRLSLAVSTVSPRPGNGRARCAKRSLIYRPGAVDSS